MSEYLKQYSRMEEHFDSNPGALEVVPMLVDGIIDKINAAKQAHEAQSFTAKGFYLGRATGIVDALRNMLDLKTGGQTAQDLDIVYNHVDLCLQASLDDARVEYLDEALDIMEGIASAWQMVPPPISVTYADEMRI